jgi:ABC-type polysaccharide/polyol phosphate export permease
MVTTEVPAVPMIYDSAKRGVIALEELRNIWLYRDLILQLIRRNIVSRYKRSLLGVAWTLINPLGNMLVLSLVFSQLFHRVAGYPVYVLSALIAWHFFAQSTSTAMDQIVWGSSLLRRIYVPRTVFVISAIGTGLVNLAISLVPLVVIMLLVNIPFRWTLLILPIDMVLLAAFALGVGLLLSAWAIYFPDIAEMYRVVLFAWMYLTPIVYPQDIIPETYRFWFLHLNPMYYLIEVFRRPVYGDIPVSGWILAGAAVVAFVTLVVGWLVFTSRADEFTYHT